ncbi:unnamed protein product [Chrysoparadoxa australica]
MGDADLRVMRLYKPRLASRFTTPGHHFMPAGTASSLGLDDSLKLPGVFGNIYMGELFTAYISVLNTGLAPPKKLVNVHVTAKLQSPTGSVDLRDHRMERGAQAPGVNPRPTLETGGNVDLIVEKRLQELGTHTLRVAVTYKDKGMPEGSEVCTLRKLYRFDVLNPVNLAMTCIPSLGVPLVEVKVKNTAQMDLLLESYEFLPEADSCISASLIGDRHMVEPRPLSPTPEAGCVNTLDAFDRHVLLKADESYQFVYRVKKEGEEKNTQWQRSRGSRESVTLGRVELTWRTTMGESGSILSAPVIYELPVKREVGVVLEGLKGRMTIGKVVNCEAVVTNATVRPLFLQLQFRTENMVGVYIHGHSFQNLGELGPGQVVRCPIQLMALVAGLHQVKGCVVLDMKTAQEFLQGNLCDVHVERPDNT